MSSKRGSDLVTETYKNILCKTVELFIEVKMHFVNPVEVVWYL